MATTAFSNANSSVKSFELNDDQFALFDIEGPYGNIDHIVISKAKGVFLILKKAYLGKVMLENGRLLINGKLPEKDFITEVLHNVNWFEHKLLHKIGIQTRVSPIVAFTHTDVPPGTKVKGVPVIRFEELGSILNQEKEDAFMDSKLWESMNNLNVLSRQVNKPRVLLPVTD